MTEPVANDRTKLLSSLVKVGSYLERLIKATVTCITVYRQCLTHRATHRVFFDADIICRALPRFHLAALRDAPREDAEAGIGDLAEVVFGRHSLRESISSLAEYCIPPGARAELLYKSFSLRQETRQYCQVLRSFLDTARNSGDPLTALTRDLGMEPGTTAVDGLGEHLSLIGDKMEECATLESILRLSSPWEELSGESSEVDGGGAAYAAALAHLQGRRPRRETANFLDALNVEAVFRVYRNVVSNEEKTSRACFPTLISATPALSGLEQRLDELKPTRDRVPLLGDELYLPLVAGLRRAARGAIGSVIDRARILQRDAIDLQEVASELDYGLRHSELNGGTGEICSPRRQEILRARFATRATAFARDWGGVLRPIERAANADRVELLSVVLSEQVRGQLLGKQSGQHRAALKRVEDLLLGYRHPNQELWGVMWAVEPPSIEGTRGGAASIALEEGLEITTLLNEGLPLHKLCRDQRGKLGLPEGVNPRLGLMLCASLPLTMDCAFLGLSMLQLPERDHHSGPGFELALSWEYSKAFTEIEQSWQRFAALVPMSHGGKVLVEILRGKELATRSLNRGEIHKTVTQRLIETGGDYLEVDFGKWRVSFDLLPRETGEMAVTVVMPYENLEPVLLAALGDFVECTSAILLTKRVLRGAIGVLVLRALDMKRFYE